MSYVRDHPILSCLIPSLQSNAPLENSCFRVEQSHAKHLLREYVADFFKKIVLFYNVFVISNFELYDINFLGIILYIYKIIYFLYYWFVERFDK